MTSVFPGCCHICKVSNRTLSRETFCILEKLLASFIKFCALSNLLFSFTSCWLAFNQPSWNVLLFSFNPIGKHCPSGPGYSSTRMKLAALYSATKTLQNSCTAKLQLFSSLLEAKQQLHSSCSGMQKRCAAFEGCFKLSAAVLQRSCRLSNAAK